MELRRLGTDDHQDALSPGVSIVLFEARALARRKGSLFSEFFS